MARTFLRQDTQVRQSDLYDDTLPAGLTLESGSASIQGDLNSLRSQAKRFLHADSAGDWFTDINAPSALDAGTKRGILGLNSDLHDLERKRILVSVTNTADVTVGVGNNYVILGAGQLPANTTAAVGAVTTRGTVVASHGGTFGTHSLSEVGGASPISPKNLCDVVDGNTRDPILSGGRTVYALLQSESAADGHTITSTASTRAQLSFVRLNATADDLELVPVPDIASAVINYACVERKALEDLNEQDFLKGAVLDVPATTTITRQVSYDNQGATAVDITASATLDIEGAGLSWRIRDDLEAELFKITEGSAGGTSTVLFGADVDVFDNNAILNDFAKGLRVDTTGQQIDVGMTSGLIASTGANDLRILGAGELLLDDGNQSGSTWAQVAGIKLSDTTAEWNNFETKFGEVSLLNAIVQAANVQVRQPKIYSNVILTTAADTDVSAADLNLDAPLPDMSGGSFLADYDVFLNGNLLRPGANASANHDYYPGSSLGPAAKLKFEFSVKVNDVLCVVSYA